MICPPRFRYTFEAENGRVIHKDFDMFGIESGEYKNWILSNNLAETRITRRQCTGIHDKNGVEIYEGDIVNPVITDELSLPMRGIFKVSYDNAQASFVLSNNAGDLCLFSDFDYKQPLGLMLLVIGNIYENPELLSSAQP